MVRKRGQNQTSPVSGTALLDPPRPDEQAEGQPPMTAEPKKRLPLPAAIQKGLQDPDRWKRSPEKQDRRDATEPKGLLERLLWLRRLIWKDAG